MSSNKNLNPCPFCGSQRVRLVGLTVRCGGCSASGPFGTTADLAMQSWNERCQPRVEHLENPGVYLAAEEAGEETL